MKSVKKIMSFVLAMMMIFSACVVSVSAAEGEQVIYFEVPEDWTIFKQVYCHIFPYGGDPLANWQSKKEKCTDEGDGIWSYDIAAKVGGIEDGVVYCVIFSIDTGLETYTTLMTTECMGDALYCNDTYYENPIDSTKLSRAAFWRNQDPAKYGPLLQVTSIGNIVGTALPTGTTAEDIFADFLMNDLENARVYSGKTDQKIIDDIVNALSLSAEKTADVLTDVACRLSWWSICWNGVTYGAVATDDEISTDDEPSVVAGLLGDANTDHTVNVKDATYIQKATAGLLTLTENEEYLADVDKSGTVNVKDATAIQKYVAGMDTGLDIDTAV